MRSAGTFTRAIRAPAADRKSELLALLADEARAGAGAGPGAGRRLPPGGTERLAALLAEIDQTILPRVLVLRAGPKEIGRISVSHRHLIGVDLPGRPAAQADNGTGALAPLFAARLAEMVAARADLTLIVKRRAAAPGMAEPSCSLAALRQALTAAATRTGFDRLRDLVMTQAGAALVWQDGAANPQFTGAAHWQPALTHLAAALRGRGRAPAGAAPVGQPRCEGIAVPVSGQQVLLLASLDQQGLAVVLPLAFGLEAITAWQRGD